MSFETWKKISLGTVAVSCVMTVFCLTPGPGLWLGQQLVYITFISHISLILGSLGVVAGMRAEGEARSDD